MYRSIKLGHVLAISVTAASIFLIACQASQTGDENKVSDIASDKKHNTMEVVVDSGPDLEFRGTISGEVLDFNDGKGDDTSAVKQFKKTGKNPYNNNPEVVNRGYTIFSTACSGCHGHLAEGKLGPALHDDYWTYPGNMYDKGLFETIYAGGQGMMGPQKGLISQDEILQIMSWIRSVYDGDPKKAKWNK